jgi:hypothetical protein
MDPRRFIEAEHMRLRMLAAGVQRECRTDRRSALLARFLADLEIHRCVVEEVLWDEHRTPAPHSHCSGSRPGEREPCEQLALSALDALPEDKRQAIGRRLVRRRAELDAWFSDAALTSDQPDAA